MRRSVEFSCQAQPDHKADNGTRQSLSPKGMTWSLVHGDKFTSSW